jgi:hypothetical protein
MKELSGDESQIEIYFTQAVTDALEHGVGLVDRDVEKYLTSMLLNFLRVDTVYGIKDKFGKPVTAVSEMLLEGDVRYNADSFAREREVHRHIGDFLLFWSGVFPEFLKVVASPLGKDAFLNPIGQGRMSYHVASTFDHDPYAEEAKILKKLSHDFETYQYGLSLVRASFEGFRRQGWHDGFQA